jgi:hypothetical protein
MKDLVDFNVNQHVSMMTRPTCFYIFELCETFQPSTKGARQGHVSFPHSEKELICRHDVTAGTKPRRGSHNDATRGDEAHTRRGFHLT